MQKKRGEKANRRGKESREMKRQERKIYIFYIWGTSPKSIIRPSKGARRTLGTCCCVRSKWRGEGAKKKKKKTKNQSESSPIQLGEGTSTLRQGFFFMKGFLPLWMKETLAPLEPLWSFLSCTDVFCKFVYATVKSEGVSVIYMVNTVAPLTCCKRGGIFLSLILHSFLSFFYSPNISLRLPSSHPNQRTRRPLLGTPCPGNPPCTAGYLCDTKRFNIRQLFLAE